MKTKKIVIAGGTGFIGSYLTKKFQEDGYEVYIISRSHNHINWEDSERIIETLNGAEIVLNLTGKSVDCRYTYKNKWKILTSRTESTMQLHKLIAQCSTPPKYWINSSTATIYRHAEDRPMDEINGEIGEGFSVHVAQNWENAFFSKELNNTKQIALRIAIVLGNGGALTPLKALTRFGFGGKQGNGKQMVSWIHIEDLYRIIQFVTSLSDPAKIYNCSAPNPVNNKTFMQELRSSLKITFGISLCEHLLKFGAFFIRTQAELILKSRWVQSKRLVESGFKFKFNDLPSAFKNLIQQ